MITEPSSTSREFLRKHSEWLGKMHAAVDRLDEDERRAAIDRASIPSIRYERYRRNGITRVRKARS